LIISSPDQDFVNQIEYQLNKIIENQIPIELGSLFELIRVARIPDKNLEFPLKVITQSPIIIRIPIEKYQGRVSDTAPYKEIFWRKEHPVDLFIEALEANMKKKFAEFTGAHIDERIFERYAFKKQVSTKLDLANSKIPVIGSLWELEFSAYLHPHIQKFALDCGLGERNSLGFGFVNPIITKHFRQIIQYKNTERIM
jgi:CRISPR-associated endoribonuclease Cas6